MNIKNSLILSIIILSSSFAFGMENYGHENKKIKLDLSLLSLNDNKEEVLDMGNLNVFPNEILGEIFDFVLTTNDQKKLMALRTVSKSFKTQLILKTKIKNILGKALLKIVDKTSIKSKSSEVINKVKRLIESGANCDFSHDGFTPIFLATGPDGDDEIAKLLIKGKANLNLQGNEQTVLSRAASYIHIEIVKALIQEALIFKGKDWLKPYINILDTDHYGYSAVMNSCVCVRNSYVRQEIIKLLVSNGADLNKQSKNGFTALMLVSKTSFLMDRERKEIIKLLLGYGADLYLKNEYGETALDLAKNPEIKKMLQEAMHKKNKKINLDS